MSKVLHVLLKDPQIQLMKKPQLKEYSELMTDLFIGDPCTRLQMDGMKLQRAREIFHAQCLGQLEVYASRKAVFYLKEGGGFFIGYSDKDITNMKLVSVAMMTGKYVRRILEKADSDILRENAEFLAKINPGEWYRDMIKGERFHLLAVGIDPAKKGSGAFRTLMSAVIRACDKVNIPITLEMHNDLNRPLFERFGFEVIKRVEDETVDIACTCMLRRPQASALPESDRDETEL